MQMIPFAPKPLAQRQKSAGLNTALMQGVSSGFAVFSIKGKVWHLSRGDDKKLITKKAYDEHGNMHDTGEPAASIEVVILNANPNLSRVYYARGYEEGADGKPDCYSNDGITPEADATDPQAVKCATCKHSQYGSKLNDNGSKGWACANSRRIAVASPSNLDEPILLRIPGASLKPLGLYAKELDDHGYMFNEVITRIGFDYSVAHPALTFKPAGLLPDDVLDTVSAQASSDLVAQMIGLNGSKPASTAAAGSDKPAPEQAAPAKSPAKATKATVKPEAAKKLDDVVATAEVKAATTNVKVEQPVTVSQTEDIASSLDDMLGSISFDD